MPIKGNNCNSSFEVRQNFGGTIATIISCVSQTTVLNQLRAFQCLKLLQKFASNFGFDLDIEAEHHVIDNSTLNSSKVCCTLITIYFHATKESTNKESKHDDRVDQKVQCVQRSLITYY